MNANYLIYKIREQEYLIAIAEREGKFAAASICIAGRSLPLPNDIRNLFRSCEIELSDLNSKLRNGAYTFFAIPQSEILPAFEGARTKINDELHIKNSEKIDKNKIDVIYGPVEDNEKVIKPQIEKALPKSEKSSFIAKFFSG